MKNDPAGHPLILILAGANGAGKSSIAGAALRESGGDYFNPDEATRRILEVNPGTELKDANSAAWHEGKRLLERAIRERLDFAIETTLGGTTIPALLGKAAANGIFVHIWFVGLEGPELHIARVRARTSAGGHNIPEGRIRQRYERSRANLIRLMPELAGLHVYDNSVEGDPALGAEPQPKLIVRRTAGAIVEQCDLDGVPQWAKPIVLAAVKHIE